MVQFFNIEVDLLSLIPALFATFLSVYNWYQLKKPADISALPIVEYGLIKSEYHEGYQLCLPVIFSNEGPNRGLITDVTIWIGEDGQYPIEVMGRAKMNEININQLYNFDWDSFEKDGYQIVVPSYPVAVDGYSTSDVIFIGFADHIPTGKDEVFHIKTVFDNNRENITKFSFFINKEDSEVDNLLRWHRVKQSRN